MLKSGMRTNHTIYSDFKDILPGSPEAKYYRVSSISRLPLALLHALTTQNNSRLLLRNTCDLFGRNNRAMKRLEIIISSHKRVQGMLACAPFKAQFGVWYTSICCCGFEAGFGSYDHIYIHTHMHTHTLRDRRNATGNKADCR